jgi:hypothetical protein
MHLWLLSVNLGSFLITALKSLALSVLFCPDIAFKLFIKYLSKEISCLKTLDFSRKSNNDQKLMNLDIFE